MTKEEKQDRVIELLSASVKTSYQIAKDTGITEATIGNYRNGKTKPQGTNVQVLLKYLSGEGDKSKMAAPQVEETAGMVSMPREVWDVIRDQAASLKAKDKQVEEVIALLKEQINKKGEGVGAYGHVAPQAAEG